MRSRKSFLARFALLAGLALLLGGAANAHAAWWKSEWTLRKKIVLDPGAAGIFGADTLGAVPLLIRLYDGNFHFASALPDGGDLRFVADDQKTVLPFHIEKFDSVLNEAFVWVKVPDLRLSGPTTLWLYYGNAKGAKAEDAKDTYDDNTVLVYHFNEKGQPAYDATTNGNSAQTIGLASESSLIGGGLRIDGHTTLTIPASPSFFWSEGSALTWSAWVKFGPPQPNAVFFSRRDGAKFFLIGADNGVPYVEFTYQGSVAKTTGGTPIAANTWAHVAVVAAGETITVFVDGQPQGTVHAPLPAFNGPMVLGGDGVGGLMNNGGSAFTGEMDELQISKIARPPGALRFAAISQGRDATTKFLTVGDDEQDSNWLSGLKTGYVGVIVGSLTIDGWVVIGVLAIMSAISWTVMIRKAGYLRRIGRGNAEFLAEWHQISSDLSALDESANRGAADTGSPAPANPVLQHAPLYHIYHLGVMEVQHRLAADEAAGDTTRALSARSMQAIRATLDGGVVRETQKLNSGMVLLTIAISGGPFLGLLGTVVGVMITFAAVASAGEVNVNAIAPGIAAALLATVAGLGVAIPALFGYNYLLTQIKSASTDMHVFIDEFVTKLAEYYSEPAQE